MRKFLLTLATVFVASLAMAQEAQEYPVVTSVEELTSYPDSTMVLFENIEVVVIEEDMGYYVAKTPCLSDGTTHIGGDASPFPMPAAFSAVGFLHNFTDWEGNTYREFQVVNTTAVTAFSELGELVNFASMARNAEIVNNSPEIICKGGTAIVTHVMDDYIFYYTLVNTGYANQPVYGVMTYPDATNNAVKGDELTGWVNGGVFKGKYTPTVVEYDEDYNVVSHKGGHYAISEDVMIWAQNWEGAINIQYSSCTFKDFNDNYVREATPIRVPYGGTFAERDGKYYYEGSYDDEIYENGNWVPMTFNVSIEVASTYVDLSQYVGKVCEDFIGGVWDYANTGDSDRLLITEFIPTVARYNNISQFLAKGEQYEEEIITAFENPLKVTYKFDDGAYKFVLVVADETGALALNYGDAIDDEETYAQLQAIQVGDMISEVKGYPQFYASSRGPVLECCMYDYSTYEVTTFVPTVVSSGEEVTSTMVVTVEDMLNEWIDCQENGTMPKIANRVVTLLDVQVVDTLDPWNQDVKYLIQGNDTMELSNLWDEDKMNFQVFERNNIVGIADFCCINTNYIYQFMPLSQEHITDASLIPEVESIEDLADYVGLPVILKNAEIRGIAEGWNMNYYLQDNATQVIALAANGCFDLQGIYEVTEYGNTFTVYSVVKAHSFLSIGDIDRYSKAFPEGAGQEYIVDGEVLVTYVDGENVFVQYDGVSDYGSPMTVSNMLAGVKTNVKIGDKLTGLKGISTPMDGGYDAEYNPYFNCGAYFTVAEDANITVVSSDNEINYSGTQHVEYIVGYNEGNYSAQAFKLYGGGKILNEEGKYYYEETTVEEDKGDGAEPVVTVARVEVASNVIDLAAYVDQTIPAEEFILGVYNVGNTTADARIFYITGFISTILEYETIADFYAAGEVDYTFTSKFLNPLTVTYVHHDSYGGGKVFVQDETGGLRIDFYTTEAMQHINIGDQLADVRGTSSFVSFYGLMYLGGYNSSYKDYTYEVCGTATPVAREVTIPELNAEAEMTRNEILATEYISDLVTLKNVSYETGTIVDQWGDEVPVAYFVDEAGNKLVMPGMGTASFESRGLVTYEKMNVTGVIDNGGINYNDASRYSLYPRSQEDIQDALGVKGVEVENGIYLDAANQVVANGAVAIVVYDINGRTVAAANAETVNANGLAQGVYVVRATYADGTVATAKVVR